MATTTNRVAAAIVVVLTSAIPVSAARAAAGDLDDSFGSAGVVVRHSEVSRSLAIAPGGQIVTAGTGLVGRSLAFEVRRYRPDGGVDASFSRDGKVTTAFSKSPLCGGAAAVAVQPDGKVVAAGRSGCAGGRFAIARYRRDGRLDRSFSGDGRQTTRFGAHCRFSQADAVAIQPDGRIVAAGRAGCTRAGKFRVTFALARYTRDGRLDRSFATDGRVTTDLTPLWDAAADVVVEPGGRIVAAGTAGLDVDESQFALVRYDSDGALDRSFGTRGIVTSSFVGEATCSTAEGHALARARDGKLVVGGFTGCGMPYFAIARYDGDGRLDPLFGGNGLVATIFDERDGCSDSVHDVVVQADLRIVAAGVAGCKQPHPSFALARYRPDGGLDATFGGDGKVTTRLCKPVAPGAIDESFEQIDAIGLYRGRILAAGGTCGGFALLGYRSR